MANIVNIDDKVLYIEAFGPWGKQGGTGVLIRAQDEHGQDCDLLLTCLHVVENGSRPAEKIKVWLSGEEYIEENAISVKVHSERLKEESKDICDLVILTFDNHQQAHGIKSYTRLCAEEHVRVLGYALGEQKIATWGEGKVKVSPIHGHICSVTNNSMYSIKQANTSDGMSGSPVVNNEGDLVGLWRGLWKPKPGYVEGVVIGSHWIRKLCEQANYQTLIEEVIGSIPQDIEKRSRTLTFRCDRQNQRRALQETLENSNDIKQYPFIFILHGDERECHNEFLNFQLLGKDNLLPKILRPLIGADAGQLAINKYFIKWPLAVEEGRLQRLQSNLAEKIAENMAADKNRLAAILNKQKAFVLLYSLIDCDSPKSENALIKKWLQFWDTWDSLSIEYPLFIFLCIKYKNMTELNWFRRIFWAYDNKKQYKLITKGIDAAQYKKIRLITLPELPAISLKEALDWVEEDVDNEFRQLKCEHYLPDVRQQIRLLYDSLQLNNVPMEDLAPGLIHIISSCLQRQGDSSAI